MLSINGNNAENVVHADGVPVRLTGAEFDVLAIIASKPDAIHSQGSILRELYDDRDMPEPKIVDVLVCKARKKIAAATDGKAYIFTVWGKGYSLRKQH